MGREATDPVSVIALILDKMGLAKGEEAYEYAAMIVRRLEDEGHQIILYERPLVP